MAFCHIKHRVLTNPLHHNLHQNTWTLCVIRCWGWHCNFQTNCLISLFLTRVFNTGKLIRGVACNFISFHVTSQLWIRKASSSNKYNWTTCIKSDLSNTSDSVSNALIGNSKITKGTVKHLSTIPQELIDGRDDFCFEVDSINIKTSSTSMPISYRALINIQEILIQRY